MGPTMYVPEDQKAGTKRVKNTCGDFKFRFADIRTRNKDSEPYLMQVKDEMISSGLAKKIVLDGMIDSLSQLFGG